MIHKGGDLNQEINPSIVNGILTTTSIVFGFTVYEIREIKISTIKKFALSVPLLLFLEYTVMTIFLGAITGIITQETALVATMNCFFNILYTMPVMFFKDLQTDLEKRKN